MTMPDAARRMGVAVVKVKKAQGLSEAPRRADNMLVPRDTWESIPDTGKAGLASAQIRASRSHR